MLEWEKKDKIRASLKKVEGLEDSDIDELFALTDETGMSLSDELLPFIATMYRLRRDSLNSAADNKKFRDTLTQKLVAYGLFMKEQQAAEQSLYEKRVADQDERQTVRFEELNHFVKSQKEIVEQDFDNLSKKSVNNAIDKVADRIEDHVRELSDNLSSAIIDTQAENKALELLKLSEQHRRSQNIFMVSAAGLIGLSIITTAVFTHITTRENTQVIANELVEYARKPDAQNYLQWLRMYDENHAVFLRTCGASGNQIVEKSGLCTPTIRVSDNVNRVFTGNSVMSQIENWWLSRSSYTIAFITFLGTIAGLIFVPMIWQNKYIRWAKRKLKYLYKNKLFNA